MTDNEIKREKTFSEELPYFKERIKEVFDNYSNPNGYDDPLYIAVLRDSNRIVRKAEEEINRQQIELEDLREIVFMDRTEEIKKKNKELKTEAVKECLTKVKNYIKTHCNPYGKPTFDYDTSVAIMRYIDNLVKEMESEE